MCISVVTATADEGVREGAADTRSVQMTEKSVALIRESDLPCFVSCLIANGAHRVSAG